MATPPEIDWLPRYPDFPGRLESARDAISSGSWFAPSGGFVPAAAGSETSAALSELESGAIQLVSIAAGNVTLEADADARALRYYREWPFELSVYVRNRGSASITVFLGFDFGSGYVEDAGTAVPPINTTGGDKPKRLLFNGTPPESATRFKVRIRWSAAGAGETLEVAHSKLSQASVTALNLGVNTTPRSEHRGYFAELIYLWSPDPLMTAERDAIGLSAPAKVGHIDHVLPAHVEGDRFDITTYAGGQPINLRGVFDEAELFAGAATNMQLVVRTPGRRSYMAPTRISAVVGEALSFTTAAPFIATLQVMSNQDQLNAVLYRNGIPVPNDTWTFLSATSIQVTSGFVLGSTYTIDYQALIRYETITIDLGGAFADYVWYVDMHAWQRYEPELVEATRTQQVVFNSRTLRAALVDRSNRDITSTTLTENDGLQLRTVPTSGYRYLDSRTVQINSDQFKASAVYFLSFLALRVNTTKVPTVTIERRRADTLAALTAAAYVTTQKDAVLPATGRYLQYRCTIGNVLDLRDVRLSSLSAKGLGLIGAGLTVPVLRP